MEISFKDKKLKKICEDDKSLKKKYGSLQSIAIVQRINELSSAENLFDISRLPHARLHLLKGKYDKCFAVDIKHPYRIVFSCPSGDVQNIKSVHEIMIIEIVDYH